MSALPKPACPHCGSVNVLPFEDEGAHKSDATFFIVFLSAFLLVAGYLIFMISSYIFFPAVVFLSIIITTRMLNRRERERKNMEKVERNYMCVDCGVFFKK
jgi:Flp pilus assembly protein TadB